MFNYEIKTFGKIADEDGSSVDVSDYQKDIEDRIAEDWSDMNKELGLGEYVWEDDHKKMGTTKVIIPPPKVEVKSDGSFNLVWKATTDAKLTKEGQEVLLDYITGQCSDGWGEGFEQTELDTISSEVDCDLCDGGGSEDCSGCDGSGKSGEENEEGEEENCNLCDGQGSEDCSGCEGSGMMTGRVSVYAHPWDSDLDTKNTIKEL